MESSAQAAPQTYAEYAISGPAGGAGATHPSGPEHQAGENPNQTPKLGTKSNSIIVSPRQVRKGMEKWSFESFGGKHGNRVAFWWAVEVGLSYSQYTLGSTIYSFNYSTTVCGLRTPYI